MIPIITLLDSSPAPLWPSSAPGWIGWVCLAGVILWLLWRWRRQQPHLDGRAWAALIGLGICIPLTSLFLGLRFPAGSALPLPGIPAEPRGPALMLLSALPWILAGGILGPIGAAVLGLGAGLLRFLWDTHSFFTPLELALLAILFSLAVRQRYRTPFFRLLRQPIFTALVLALFYLFLFVLDAFLDGRGAVAVRLDYALTRAGASALALGGELLIAGCFAQVTALAFPNIWGSRLPLQPSPAERSLESRFLLGTGALIAFLLIFLLIGDWVVAGDAARQMLEDRLRGSTQNAAQSVPFFLETGQNLAMQAAADPDLLTATVDQLPVLLGKQLHTIPYFSELLLLDPQGQILGRYPDPAGTASTLAPEESAGVTLALNGVLTQIYGIAPAAADGPARVSFVIAVLDSSQRTSRILIGRADLAANPFTQPLIESLKGVSELGGNGILIDENGRILYHPDPAFVMGVYSGQRSTQPAFFDDTAPDGTRSLVYYQPVPGRSWAVIATVPAQRAQQIALTIAAPLSLLILILALVALVSLRLGLRVVTSSLQSLAAETVRIAQGQLDRPLPAGGVDEVGRLRGSFEQMRLSLQARLGELNRLLLVSQGIASSLQMEDAVKPVLEALRAAGASSARVVLAPSAALEDQAPSRFGLGPQSENYSVLDGQLLGLAARQDQLVLPQLNRTRALELDPGRTSPAALMAFALRHEDRYYGVLWAAYDAPRSFPDEEVRFMATLAGQAALAAANSHLFLTAEIGRQRLAAILDSTPDPVLVTDHQNRLLLANPAAEQALGPAVGNGAGQPLDKLIGQKALLDILAASSPDKQSAEIALADGQVYFATASPVIAKGQLVGRVCILRDVTHFKELDLMKSEFVNTVSHDLRSPLTAMHGYATMLEMVGALNEEQKEYLSKMVSGVENMSRLVNTLLDLGRLEMGIGLQVETVSLLDVLEAVTAPLQAQAAQKSVALAIETPQGTAPLIQADAALLQQAMYNLIENAIKYTPPNGRVTVRLKTQDDTMLLEVQDTGIGIAPADRPRLFEKFFRGSQREARKEKGSGLGLAIVKSIADRHGGTVWLESRLGEGSTFSLLIPLRQRSVQRSV